ncbi:MAG: universal stress protein [Jiangellaceae bacterium]|nr:universal stress protein [Jiangellaceae bacterium]
MKTVLAALDASAAARPVLETALGFARLTDATVHAVHVTDGPVTTPESLATRAGVDLRLLDGPVDAALLDALAGAEVIAAVLGARATPGGRRPTGRHCGSVVEQARKPVLVVPPEAAGEAPRSIRRLLVPLDGTELTSRPVVDVLCPLLADQVEFLVLHVFTRDTMPRVLDDPRRDLELWGGEFLARHCPNATEIELRVGSVQAQVAAVTREQPADLIVLSWSQDSSPGHAAVVRDVLADTTLPVILLPALLE